jgi:hypothetical protein
VRALNAERLDALAKAPGLERLRVLQLFKDRGPGLGANAVAEREADGGTRYRIAQELGISCQAVNQWR